MLINLNIGNFRVKDIPIPARYNKEISKIKLRSFIPRISFLLLKGLLKRIYIKYILTDPIAAFLSLTFILFLIFLGAVISIGDAMALGGIIFLLAISLLVSLELVLAAIMLNTFKTSK